MARVVTTDQSQKKSWHLIPTVLQMKEQSSLKIQVPLNSIFFLYIHSLCCFKSQTNKNMFVNEIQRPSISNILTLSRLNLVRSMCKVQLQKVNIPNKTFNLRQRRPGCCGIVNTSHDMFS